MAADFDAERFGFHSERTRHLDEVRRALADLEAAAGRVREAIDAGWAPARSDLASLVSDAAQTQARGTALAALDAVAFIVKREQQPG